MAGDEGAAKASLRAKNSFLQGRPINLIQRAQGLAEVVRYLQTRLST